MPGTAVYRTRTLRDVPPVMSWQTKRIRSLHERLFVLTVRIESMPWVHDADRLTYNEIGDGFWRAIARFGFMERPDIPAVLRKAQARGCPIDPTDATYLVGHGAPGYSRRRPDKLARLQRRTPPTSRILRGAPPTEPRRA